MAFCPKHKKGSPSRSIGGQNRACKVEAFSSAVIVPTKALTGAQCQTRMQRHTSSFQRSNMPLRRSILQTQAGVAKCKVNKAGLAGVVDRRALQKREPSGWRRLGGVNKSIIYVMAGPMLGRSVGKAAAWLPLGGVAVSPVEAAAIFRRADSSAFSKRLVAEVKAPGAWLIGALCIKEGDVALQRYW